MLPMSVDGAIKFLDEAAKYFSNRPTGGEDRAYWANVYNSERCKWIAQFLRDNHQ
jgi:hypothetical protein